MQNVQKSALRIEEAKGSFSTVKSVFSRKLLTGYVIASLAVGSIVPLGFAKEGIKQATGTIAPQISCNNKHTEGTPRYKTFSQVPLKIVLSRIKRVKIAVSENHVQFFYPDGSELKVSHDEFERVAKQLKDAKGTVRVYQHGVSEHMSRRIEKELKVGEVVIMVERRDWCKILEYARKGLSYNDGIEVFNKGSCSNPLLFPYPKEFKDYVEKHGRELMKVPFIGDILALHHTLNKGMAQDTIKKFQVLATEIVRANYGDKEVTPEEAAIAINKWVSNNILYCNDNAFVSSRYPSAVGVLMNGTGICSDYANLAEVLFNSIGIPAYVISIGHPGIQKKTGGGFHTAVEVNLNGKWYIFDPTNKYKFTEDYYTPGTYARVIAFMEYRDPRFVIIPSRILKN
jgi:hypothetical protein